MIRELYNSIKNLIKIGTLLSVDDNENIQFGTISAFGKEQNTALITPYGLENNPPVNSLVITFQQSSNESGAISLATDPKNREKGLKVGEVKITNNVAGSSILLKEDGTILVTGDITFLGDITAQAITATSIETETLEATTSVTTPSVETETLEATTSVTSPSVTNNTVELMTHIHSDPQGGVTGPPQ